MSTEVAILIQILERKTEVTLLYPFLYFKLRDPKSCILTNTDIET